MPLPKPPTRMGDRVEKNSRRHCPRIGFEAVMLADPDAEGVTEDTRAAKSARKTAPQAASKAAKTATKTAKKSAAKKRQQNCCKNRGEERCG